MTHSITLDSAAKALYADYIQRADHHPEWCNVYNKVDIELNTHEADGITERDFALARHIEKIN